MDKFQEAIAYYWESTRIYTLGIASFRQYNSIQETLMSADNRMYRAKELGRNRVITEEEPAVGAE